LSTFHRDTSRDQGEGAIVLARNLEIAEAIMLPTDGETRQTMVRYNILEEGLATPIHAAGSNGSHGIVNCGRDSALKPLARLRIGKFHLLKAASAIAGIVINLVFTCTTLSTLDTMAVVHIPAHELLGALHTLHLLNFVALNALAGVVHMEISANAKRTTGVTQAVIDWRTSPERTVLTIGSAFKIPCHAVGESCKSKTLQAAILQNRKRHDAGANQGLRLNRPLCICECGNSWTLHRHTPSLSE